ncbi:NHLRC2 [Symbiodinium natans]|uniref:NHLRC2 protein n=1 Tax=Symbiodinium natans TaxID=878477 RepID=A0A812MTL2_9DINO|nr:NHLRC2 [Symbiodinium natans]
MGAPVWMQGRAPPRYMTTTLHEPMGMAVCRGELLIADYRNARIRAYNLETGIITTKVGSVVGYSGDGGAPSQAKLNGPTGVACDSLRGYWIADTGNSAIRGVLVVPGQSDVISTVIGGLGQGLAPAGTWTTAAQLRRPMQIAMSNTEWGAPRSLTFVDTGSAIARFVPLGTRVMEGAVQHVIGTGEQGYRQNAAKTNLALDNPEGIAAHHSTVFVSDTVNHRIVMVICQRVIS